jgi:anaerobic selenocysteine-containing dehydrogenase
MIVARRDFLRLLGVTAGATGLGCNLHQWLVPDRLVQAALRGPGLESEANTICGLCGAGCGVTVRLVDGLPVGLRGSLRHPLNRGGLCPVGQAALDVLYSPARVVGPLRRGRDGVHHPVAWERALGEISEKLARLPGDGAGGRVAFLNEEPGQLLHELVQRFVHALGSASLARPQDADAFPFTLMQGLDGVPGFDLSRTDLVLTLGLDLFEDGPAPVHAIAAMVGSRPTEQRCALIHVGTRLSPSAAKAQLRVPVRPGTHGAFALGVAHVLVREGSYNRRFVGEHGFGFEEWTDEQGRARLGFRRLLLERYYPDRAAQLCGCEPAAIVRVARRLAEAKAPLVLAGGEATSGSNATWTAMSAHALNALLGAFDRPGGVVLPPPMELTPLPPLPSGISVPAKSIFAHEGRPGFGVDPLEAFADRMLAGSGTVEVLFLLGANPLFTSPSGDRFRKALQRIPLVVALTPFRDETAVCADLILPIHLPLEAWQESTTPATVPFSVLGLAHPVVKPLFDTRHPGDVLLELARRTGGAAAAALPWGDYVDYLKHRLRGLVLSGQGTVFSGSFEESWVHFLEERGWRFLEHSEVDRFWEDLGREGGWWNPVSPRGDWARLFRTPSGRFEFFSRSLERRLCEVGGGATPPPTGDAQALRTGIAALGLTAEGDEACLPHFEPPHLAGSGELVLVPFRTNTARGRWGVVSPMLLEMFGYPVLSGWQTWIELCPDTARELGLADGDTVAVESESARFEAELRVRPGAVPGVAHVPLGLGHEAPDVPSKAIGANPVRALAQMADSLSGVPSLTSTRVRLGLVRRRQHGGPAPLHGGPG